MNSKLITILLFIAIILIITISAETYYANYSKSKIDRELKDIVVGNIEIETLPSINLKEKSVEHYPDLIKRPLFINTRKPIETVTTVEVKPETKTVTFKHELIGVFGDNTTVNALFRKKRSKKMKNKNGKFFIVNEGEKIEGWLIKKINSNTVIIENNGKTETIEWSKYKPKIQKIFKAPIKKKHTSSKTKKIPLKNNPFNKKNNPFNKNK